MFKIQLDVRCAGAFHAWSSTTLTSFISASHWHERQDLDPADENPWQVRERTRTWMIELEGSIERRVKPGLVRKDESCNGRG